MKQGSYRYGKVKLSVLLLALPLSAWFSGCHKTMGLWLDCRQNEKQLHELQQTPNMTNDSIPSEIYCSVLSDAKLLEWIRQRNENWAVTIQRYTPWNIPEGNGLQRYMAELVLAGRFIPMLKLIAALESEGRYGCMAAAVFQMQVSSGTHEKQLQLTLWMEQITEK